MSLVLGMAAHIERSAAAVMKDGKLLAAASEERYSRLKHDSSPPLKAALSCMNAAGVYADELDMVAVSCSPALILSRSFIPIMTGLPGTLHWFGSYGSSLAGLLTLPGQLKLFFQRRIPHVFIQHHAAHAAAVWKNSGFAKSMILVIDGMGEYVSTTVFLARDNRMRRILEIPFPHSLGYFYEAVTVYLGFRHTEAGKVMGLSSYGDISLVREMSELFRFRSSGMYDLNLDYFAFQHGNTEEKWDAYLSASFIRKFGPPRFSGEPIQQHHCNIAKAVQVMLEKVVIKLIKAYLPPGWPLCIGGGVALNCLMNKAVLEQIRPSKLFVMPASDDCGTAVGAALLAS